jgi:hypothetical protein
LGTQDRQFFDTLDNLSLSPDSLPEIVASTSFLAGTKIRGATMAMMVSPSLPRRQGIPMGPPLAVSMLCYSLWRTWSDIFQGADTVGAGIDFSQNRAFFTKNGALIGMATKLVIVPHY